MTNDLRQTTYDDRLKALLSFWFKVVSCQLSVVSQHKIRAAPGFTLIETFVAIIILATAITGTLALASQGLNSADISGDQITASFLAQDAVEYVRYARDSAKLAGQPWLSNLDKCVNRACFLDSSQALDPNNPTQCPGGNCRPMEFNADSGFYNYNDSAPPIHNASITGANPDSKFTRVVRITTPIGGLASEARIDATVSWTSRGGKTRTVNLQEDIYDWQ